MPRLPNTVRWRDVSGGVVQKVLPDIALENSVPFSLNLLYEENLGEATSRLGTNRVGVQLVAGQDCEGLFNHIESTSANNLLLAAFNGTVYNVLTAAQIVTGFTAGNKVRATTFLNNSLFLNGIQARSYSAATGQLTTGGVFDLANIPANVSIPIEFKDRMYAKATDRLYYTTTPTNGVLSWINSGSGSIQVEQEDGGGTLQALNKVPSYLMIYKERSLKRWNTESTFPEDLVRVGTQSHESVVVAKGRNFFFYGPNGFYETDGSYPRLISRPIQRFVDAIPASNYSSIYGWTDDEHIYWSVGDLTVDFDRGYTETYTNVVLRYTIRSQHWAPLTYGHKLIFFSQYLSGGSQLLVAGDDDGQVIQLNTGTTDYSSQAISYILQSPEFDFGDRGRIKTVSDRIIVHSDLTAGALLQARVNYGNWRQIGTVGDLVSEVEIKHQLEGNVFEFRITDSITNEQVKLRGLDFPSVFIHDTRTQ